MGGGRAAAAGDEHRRQFAKGSVVEVAGDKGVRYLATVISTPWISWSSWSPTSQKNPNSNKFFVEYRSLFDHDGCTPLRKHVEIHRVRPLPPPNHATSFRLHDVVEAFYRHGWWTGVITRVLENSRFVVNLRNSQEEIECGLLELRVHQEWIGGTWVLPANKVLPGNKEQKTNQLKGGVNRPKKRGSMSMLLGHSPNASVPGVSPNRIIRQCTETSERQKEIPMHASAGNGNAVIGSNANQGSPLRKTIESKEVGVSSNRIIGQRIETSERQTEIPMHAGANGNAKIGSDAYQGLPFVKTSPLQKTIESKEVGVSPNQIIGQCTETSERQKEIPMHASATNGDAKIGSDANQGLPFVKTSPLPKPIESKEVGVSPNRIIGQCTGTIERQKEIPMNAGAANDNAKIGSDANQGLPFVKTSPLWKTIESMDVFQVMPQKPHFRPLNCCNEGSREGLAIGCMVTFSSLVKKTSELQFDDPRGTIEDILETLLDLEAHGFDVKLLQDRLTLLLLIKDRQEHLQNQSKKLESQIVEHNHEKTQSDEEIGEINKQIRELQEKRALALSMKKIKESEIASLQSDVNTINKGIKNIQLDFEELLAAPW
ncbi:polyribonucleotide phosphorylase, putative [Actinidia rufa]|uniref:Polyribonucleotide phosphorylase, putative n=1 Tax=Actinidia rufa TaxID=165716 RepID=A0A7J0GS75_9ERIC|nr:polyribonucleotide phosphorylase, putative [Actinidia rufa]